MEQQLEHHEHAGHASEHGNKRAALLISVLAALLAITEQGGRHAEIRVSENAISAADAWTQYQGKSVRQALAHDLSTVLASLDVSPLPAAAAKRSAALATLSQEQVRYDQDPADGKLAIARRAQRFEAARDEALERAHSYDNGAAALELGIVLSTVSVITASGFLLAGGALLGAVGALFALAGLLAPALGAL